MHFAYCALSNTSLAGGDGPHEAVMEADEPLLEVERPLVPEDQSGDHFERHKGVNGPDGRVRFMQLFSLDVGGTQQVLTR